MELEPKPEPDALGGIEVKREPPEVDDIKPPGLPLGHPPMPPRTPPGQQPMMGMQALRPPDLVGLPRLPMPHPPQSVTPDSPRSGMESPRTPKSESSRAKEMLARMVSSRLQASGRMPDGMDPNMRPMMPGMGSPGGSGPTSPRAMRTLANGEPCSPSTAAKVGVLSGMFDTMAADDLVIQGAKASVAMVLI